MQTNSIRISVFVAVFLFPTFVQAQGLSLGIIGGAGLSDDFQSQDFPATVLAGGSVSSATVYTHTYSRSKDYIVGATMAVGLPAHFSVEIDGLYRAMNFTTFTSSVISGGSAPNNTVLTWEFPVLAKYELQTRQLKPFFELGPSFRISGNLNDTLPSSHGVTAGTGLEKSLRKLRFSAGARYTRWASDSTISSFQPRTNPNQVEVLVGWAVRVRKLW
jgi:hypothetical protein